MKRIITLLTDFGLEDHYVGTMKGVILSINPHAQIIDISHSVEPQNVSAAAFQIAACYTYFPEASVHCVVVDPTVGSPRNSIAVKTDAHYFVGPDNGVFSHVLKAEKNAEIRYVTNEKYFLKNISSTFHGRDIFAPVCAYLASENIFTSLGPLCTCPVILDIPEVEQKGSDVYGTIIHCDHFGNLITNIPFSFIKEDNQYSFRIQSRLIDGVFDHYASVEIGELLVLKGSSGYLEIASREASAQKKLNASCGDRVIMSVQ